jgi:NAD(P)-dependent dehydrogenase (short-subunit alcohol dehydrogenase family)
MPVAVVARRHNGIEAVLPILGAEAHYCDATDELAVASTFSKIERDLGPVKTVVYCVQGYSPGQTLDVAVAAFEESWRQNCLGAFIVGRQAARSMAATGGGSIIFVGSTSSLVGRAGLLNLAVGKFGVRALAQVMARELGERGVHVAHVIIDAHVDDGEPVEDGQPVMLPEDMAELIRQIDQQPKTVWTHELDARPWNERFWEHC